MARSQVFNQDTTLYHPVEGARVFPKGETDPGAAWSDSPGGDRSETSMPSVLTDLIAANDRADALGVKMDKMASDMDRTAAEATEAKEALEGAQQAAIAAKEAQDQAETLATTYMGERDAAREELASARDALGKTTADLENAQAEAGKVAGLVEQLDTANQTIADLNDKLAKVKPPKAPKADAAPPAPAADTPDPA